MLHSRKEHTPIAFFEQKTQEIRDVFRKFDMNKDGLLHPYEFQVALEAMGFDLHSDTTKNILFRFDVKTNFITLKVFEEIVSQIMSKRQPHDEAASIFKLFDLNDVGEISRQDLRQVCKEAGENISENELQVMIEEFDVDGNGKINEEEFIAILLDKDNR